MERAQSSSHRGCFPEERKNQPGGRGHRSPEKTKVSTIYNRGQGLGRSWRPTRNFRKQHMQPKEEATRSRPRIPAQGGDHVVLKVNQAAQGQEPPGPPGPLPPHPRAGTVRLLWLKMATPSRPQEPVSAPGTHHVSGHVCS